MKRESKKVLSLVLAVILIFNIFPGKVEAVTNTSTKAAESNAGPNIHDFIPEDAVEFEGNYYKIYKDSSSWESARDKCEILKGHLVCITSDEEQQFIETLCEEASSGEYYPDDDGMDFYMGGTDSTAEGTWTWLTDEDWVYEKWNEDEPDDDGGIQHYLRIVKAPDFGWDWEWDDFDGTALANGYICEWELNKCGDNLYWSYANGTISIVGYGPMWDWDSCEDTPWAEHKTKIRVVQLEENGITTIGKNAFSTCENLQNVFADESIDSLTEIKEDAFSNCSSLEYIDLRDSIEILGDFSFSWTNLKEFIAPENIQEIGAYAFSSCKQLERVELGEELNTVDEYAFSQCDALKKIYFNGDCPVFGGNAFEDLKAYAYYPMGNSTWNNQLAEYRKYPVGTNYPLMLSYGGEIIWRPQETWDFFNSGLYFEKEGAGSYLSQTDAERFYKPLEEEERKVVENEQANDTKNGWGGSCYGMSVWTCLVSAGVKSSNNIFSTGNYQMTSYLNDFKISNGVKSAINYYQIQQYMLENVAIEKDYLKLSNVEKINDLKNHALDAEATGKAFLIKYGWTTQNDKGEYKVINGHAVVGYGLEEGVWKKTINGITDVFTRRILIYDCSYDRMNSDYKEEDLFIYFNDNGVWGIPRRGVRNEGGRDYESPESNGDLMLVTSNTDLLNRVDYNTGRYQPIINGSTEQIVFLNVYNNSVYEMAWDYGTAVVSGMNVEQNGVGEKLNVLVSASEGTASNSSRLTLPEDASYYTVSDADSNMKFSVYTSDVFQTAEAESQGAVTFEKTGGISMELEDSARYKMSLTVDEPGEVIPWNTVMLEGDNATKIEIKKDKDGIVVSGDCLNQMTVTSELDETEKKITIHTAEDKVKISSEDNHIVVSEDNDGDGKFEHQIITTKKENSITASNIKKNASAQSYTFKIGATAKGGTLSYKSNNSKLKVSSNGTVTVPANYVGKANITITATGKDYQTVSKTITVTIQKINCKITASDISKIVSSQKQKFKLKVSRTGKGKITYKSNNESITVDKYGNVSVKPKYIGKATITITVAANGIYNQTLKKITVTVKPAKTKFSSVTNVKTRKIRLKWKKNLYASGYQIQYSTNKKFTSGVKTKWIKKNSTISYTTPQLKKRTYYVRIRAYKVKSNTKYYASWGDVKSIKVVR